MSVELWNLTPSLLFFKQGLLFDIDEIEVKCKFRFP